MWVGLCKRNFSIQPHETCNLWFENINSVTALQCALHCKVRVEFLTPPCGYFSRTQASERCIAELDQNCSWTWTESLHTVLSLSLWFELMSTRVGNIFLSEQSTARPWTRCALSRCWYHWFSQSGRAYSIPWGEWFFLFNLNLFGNVDSWHVCHPLQTMACDAARLLHTYLW